MRWRRFVGIAAAVTGFCCAQSVAAGEIIYTHGTIQPPNSGPWTAPGALMAINDDGSGRHTLLSPSQVPTGQTAVCCASLQANSPTLAFDGITYSETGSTLGDGLNYEGAYVLSGGKPTRLSPAPLASPGNESSDTPLALTADGRVVYERTNCQNVDNMNVLPTCENGLNVIPDTGGSSATWTYYGPNNEPPFSFAADPVNGGLLAYVSLVSVDNVDQDDLLIANQAASSATVVATQPDGGYPAWSPDGSELVDATSPPPPLSGINTPAALWLYPASASATPRELISDPSSPSTAFASPVFIGQTEIVFEAENNLWEIPASCNLCTFPANAKQLTTDGTSAAPDSGPTWTSKTVIGPSNPPPPPTTKLKVTVKPAANQKVVKHKGIVATLECNIACKLAAVAGVKIAGSKKELLTRNGSGTLKADRPQTLTFPFKKSELKEIEKALAHHKKVTAVVTAVARDSAKQKAAASKSFTVEH